MPGVGTRLLEKTLRHLSATLEEAEQTHLHASERSAARSIDPRVKVVGALLLTIASISAHRLEVAAGLLILLTATARYSGISWQRILAAWASGLFFAAIVAVPAIFTSGWKIAVLLVLRSEASLTCWLLVIMTTPFNLVLRALRALHIPAVFIAILAMTFRYIFLLVATAQDMLFSRRSRIVGRLNGADNRKLLVSTAGVLLGKSIQMSDDVYHAMLSRGFRGEIYVLEDFRMIPKDWLVLSVISIIAAFAFVMGR
jgi:cobalt ECF transporter T component CbiQ